MHERRKRILLVDDSEIFLEAARVALSEAGYEVMCASSLAQLVELRKRGLSDLVLMDVQMPEAFGDDVALSLREAYGISAPIYLLSSLDESDLAERVEWARVEGFISKEVGLEGLVDRVRSILPPAS